MSTDQKRSLKKTHRRRFEIERIPEPMFGGTRERLGIVPDDEPAPDDTGATREAARIEQASIEDSLSGRLFDKAY